MKYILFSLTLATGFSMCMNKKATEQQIKFLQNALKEASQSKENNESFHDQKRNSYMSFQDQQLKNWQAQLEALLQLQS